MTLPASLPIAVEHLLNENKNQEEEHEATKYCKNPNNRKSDVSNQVSYKYITPRWSVVKEGK